MNERTLRDIETQLKVIANLGVQLLNRCHGHTLDSGRTVVGQQHLAAVRPRQRIAEADDIDAIGGQPAISHKFARISLTDAVQAQSGNCRRRSCGTARPKLPITTPWLEDDTEIGQFQ